MNSLTAWKFILGYILSVTQIEEYNMKPHKTTKNFKKFENRIYNLYRILILTRKAYVLASSINHLYELGKTIIC